MKIGIYGGTFNPPHLGHLAAARTASSALGLDRLVFVPAGVPPHKVLPAGSPTEAQRLEMTAIPLGSRKEVVRLWHIHSVYIRNVQNLERPAAWVAGFHFFRKSFLFASRTRSGTAAATGVIGFCGHRLTVLSQLKNSQN